jgi:site-specific recombinase XerD
MRYRPPVQPLLQTHDLGFQSRDALFDVSGPHRARSLPVHVYHLHFTSANLRNPNTRRAYCRAVADFFRWCTAHRVRDLAHISPTVVAAYVEQLQQTHAKPSVKQHLAAVRMLFDWLVTGQVIPVNPAHSVRGPKYVVKRGKTPVLTAEETRQLLDAIQTQTISGLRDRALIGVLVFSFARIGAALAMNVEDYYPEGKRWKLLLHEKGGKEHVVPVHHTLEQYLDAYLDAADLRGQPKGPLFRSLALGAGRPLSVRALAQSEAWRMIRRRAARAGIETKIGCHTFRATGITTYLENGGTLEHAQQIAAHESPRTTKLYDRTTDQVSLDEIERIAI